MPAFRSELDALTRQLDPAHHGAEIHALRRCRSLADLEGLAKTGWLTPLGTEPRLKLVRHGSGTFLVVEYVDGWSKRLAQQPFGARR